MKSPLSTRVSQALALLLLTTTVSQGVQDKPIVAIGIRDITASAATTSTKVSLNGVFRLDGVSATVVRFATSQGNIDVDLLSKDAPKTVTNFLRYVKRARYDGSFIHRSARDFVLGGGGYKLVDGQTLVIPTDPPIANEFKVSNTRGTLAMAKLSNDPNSATSQWYFNQSNTNTQLLDHDNGGYTVFGRIIGKKGLEVMDKIGALPIHNFGIPFTQVPVVNYKGGAATGKNLVEIRTLKTIPLLSGDKKDPALLKLSVGKNTNPAVVKASISGKNWF
jgi:cyclophilin family peptidyl-prolyl cis-trans isomerase